MKKLLELVSVWGAAIAVTIIAVALASGCSTTNCENSDSAEFPTVERWWK